MSWSLTTTQTGEAIENGGLEPVDESPKSDAPEQREAVAAAKKAVAELVASGVVGSKDKEFYVVLGGHANPGHEPSPNFANDMLTINVSQVAKIKGDA